VTEAHEVGERLVFALARHRQPGDRSALHPYRKLVLTRSSMNAQVSGVIPGLGLSFLLDLDPMFVPVGARSQARHHLDV